MKKLMFAIAILLLISFVGCADSDDDVVVITERFFVMQMTDIVINHRNYEGRTIQMEGLFREIQGLTRDFYVVMRYAVCCEIKPFWFEVSLNGFEPLENDAWVEVIGTLDMQTGLPVLQVTSLTELEERGEVLVGS